MLLMLSNLNSNLALTLGYLNPALNNSAQSSLLGFLKKIIIVDLLVLLLVAEKKEIVSAYVSLGEKQLVRHNKHKHMVMLMMTAYVKLLQVNSQFET